MFLIPGGIESHMPANVLQSTPGRAMSSCFKGRRNSRSVGIKEQLQQWPEMPGWGNSWHLLWGPP